MHTVRNVSNLYAICKSMKKVVMQNQLSAVINEASVKLWENCMKKNGKIWKKKPCTEPLHETSLKLKLLCSNSGM